MGKNNIGCCKLGNMARSKGMYVVYAGIGLWFIAILVSTFYHGFFNTLLNPFLWILAVMEFIEFFVWLFTGGDIYYFIENFATREAGLVNTGMIGSLAAIVTSVGIYSTPKEVVSSKRSLLLLSGIVVWPLVGGLAPLVFAHLASKNISSDSETPATNTG